MRSLQPRVLRFGLLEDLDVGGGVFTRERGNLRRRQANGHEQHRRLRPVTFWLEGIGTDIAQITGKRG
jgi:hypothetical protein